MIWFLLIMQGWDFDFSGENEYITFKIF